MSARFEARQMGPTDPHPRMWGIWDNGRDEWVHNNGDVERYTMLHSAQAWLAGQRYLNEVYHGGRAAGQP